MLSAIRRRISQAIIFKPQPSAAPAAGVYHFVRQSDSEKSRIHLRVDPDGSGVLMVNASRVFHLNPSAVFMAHLILSETPPRDAIALVTREFAVSTQQAQQDFEALSAQVDQLVRPDGACPVCELELETTAPFSAKPSAPYRMDLAITYRCQNACAHCYNARPRSHPELSTEEWFQVLDKLWGIGIPHIVFTGGEPTLRDDLPQLVAHAEKNGQITGINTNGRKLKHPTMMQSLIDAGLDHAQITLESHLPAIHDKMVCLPGAWEETVAGLKNALASRLFVMTNTTLLKDNAPFLADTLTHLGDLGVPTVGLNALIYSGKGETVGTGLSAEELPALLDTAQRITSQYHQRLIWYTPTQYCQFDPMSLQLGVKGCTAALYNMCIEPDGKVLPCQSYYTPVGDIRTDTWHDIWNNPLCISLRERQGLPEECNTCMLLPECGGGCPLERQVQPK
jgi:radical SAM protein with 4Fe4S-binding SPASM domain